MARKPKKRNPSTQLENSAIRNNLTQQEIGNSTPKVETPNQETQPTQSIGAKTIKTFKVWKEESLVDRQMVIVTFIIGVCSVFTVYYAFRQGFTYKFSTHQTFGLGRFDFAD